MITNINILTKYFHNIMIETRKDTKKGQMDELKKELNCLHDLEAI